MDKSVKTQLLLVAIFSLWVLHTSAPRFNDFLPSYNPNEKIQVPIAQALNLVIGASISLTAYTWLYLNLDGRVPLSNTLLFLLCSFFVTTGHGIHSTCVIEQAMMGRNDSLYELVDFLHVKISHNMFVLGFYGMLALIMLNEVSKTLEWLKIKKERGEISNIILNCSSPMCSLLIQWFWPLLMGCYFSSFSRQTMTLSVTMAFYVCMLVYSLATCFRLAKLGSNYSNTYLLLRSRLVVFSSLSKATLIGAPLALFYYL